MKYLGVTICSALLFVAQLFCCSNSTQATTSPLHVDLSMALGFVIAQQFSLEIITDNYPSLSPQVEFANHKFNISFGAAETNMRRALRDISGDKYPEVISTVERSVQSEILHNNSNQITREIAASYLDEIESRAEGNIVSPILETLLHYQFVDNPANEFIRGFRAVFRTTGHPKSKGLDVQIEVSQSWNSKEGRRPNVIQFFGSNNGRGPVYASIMVRDFIEEAGLDPTDEEINALMSREGIEELASEMFSDHNLEEMATGLGLNNIQNVETNRIVLDRWPGAVVSFIGDGQNLDIVLTVYNRMYMIMYRNYLILVQFQVAKLPDDTDDEMDKKIAEYLPLFRLIANSLVIQSQY